MHSYDFDAKRQYRSRVWAEIEKGLTTPRFMRRVVYLDTREALESRFLIERGYNPELLYAVNMKPVEVALLTRRLDALGLPRVNTVGVDWLNAMSRCGRADVLHFDGTSCLNDKMAMMLRASIRRNLPRVVAVNMLGGREGGAIFDVSKLLASEIALGHKHTSHGSDINQNHRGRIIALAGLVFGKLSGDRTCFAHVTKVRWGSYTSTSKQPMVWAVFSLTPHTSLNNSELAKQCYDAAKFGIAPSCCSGSKTVRLIRERLRAVDDSGETVFNETRITALPVIG